MTLSVLVKEESFAPEGNLEPNFAGVRAHELEELGTASGGESFFLD